MDKREHKTFKCTRCDKTKPISEFHKSSSKRGHMTWCKKCQAEYNTGIYYHERGGKERMKRYSKEYYHRRLAKDPNWHRNQHLKQRYGITIEDYDRMLKEQGGRCKICQTPGVKSIILGDRHNRYHRLYIDHDHETGEIRGLLCYHCNIVLGHLFDDLERARAVVKHLEQ